MYERATEGCRICKNVYKRVYEDFSSLRWQDLILA